MSPSDHRFRSCTCKRAHLTYKSAERRAREINRTKGPHERKVEPYKCTYFRHDVPDKADHWHNGKAGARTLPMPKRSRRKVSCVRKRYKYHNASRAA